MLETILTILLVLVTLAGVGSFIKIKNALKKHQAPAYNDMLEGEIDLPSVSICIPARNERHALVPCLESVLASTYERQEIIVLDDVSGDDTSALIKSFASEGVRFVKGAPLKKNWLGKNHALQGLLEEASGTYILFIDVDTRLKPETIEHFVRYAVSNRLDMVSVLPRREDDWRASVVWSPLRYFWSVLFYKKQHQSVSSSAWLIRRAVLQNELEGFSQVSMMVQPEQRFADQLQVNGRYRYLIGTSNFGVAYEKKWRSQLFTSIRTILPLFKGNRMALIGAAIALFVLLLPYVVTGLQVFGVINTSYSIVFLSVLASITWWCVYGLYTRLLWRRGWWVGVLVWPVLLLQEILLMLASLYAYTFRTLHWKGRTIQPQAEN